MLWAPAPLLEWSAVAAQEAVRELPVGVSMVAAQRPGDTVVYELETEPRAAYLVAVEQLGLDVIVHVTAPDGSIVSYGTPIERYERELVLIESNGAETYRIGIGSDEPTDSSGRHSIRVERVSADRIGSQHFDALRAMSAAAAANASVDDELGWQRAHAAYERAAESSHAAGETRLRAHALFCLAMIEYWHVNDWQRSAALASQAVELYRTLGEQTIAADAMLLQARALIEEVTVLGAEDARVPFTEALTLLEESRAIHAPLGDEYELARRDRFVGLAHNNMGQQAAAQEAWQRAALGFEAAGHWIDLFMTRTDLGVAAIQEGRVRAGIDILQDVLDDPRHATDRFLHATILDNLGAAHRELGNIDEALRSYSTAYETHLEVYDHHGAATSLSGIASTYFVSGELDLAGEYAEQARALADSTGEGRISASSRTTIGDIAFLVGDYEGAHQFHEAALSRTSSRLLRSYRHVLLARDLTALGQYQEARTHAATALSLAEEAGSLPEIADAQLELGKNDLATGNVSAAVGFLDQALSLYESLGLRGSQADAEHGLALAARADRDLDDALRHAEASLDHIEAISERVSSPELRARFRSVRSGYYDTLIGLQMAQHESSVNSGERVAAALTTSERSRSRLTIDLLSEASINLRGNLDDRLVEERRHLYDELGDRRLRRDALLGNGPLEPDDNDELTELLADMAALENRLNLLETELRSSNPTYASIAAPSTLTAGEIQSLLDADSILVQYALGDEQSFVWVVTMSSIDGFALPPRATIEAAARRAYEGLRRPGNGQRQRQALADLGQLVLEPIAHLLDASRVLVAADGALQYIPFSVLPIESAGELVPIVESREVVGVPSFSVIATQRARSDTRSHPKSLAIFADPVFETSDQRFGERGTVEVGGQAAPQARAAACADCRTRWGLGENLTRLAATGVEARAIADLVPADQRILRSGFDASRAQLLAEDLSQYRVVHFATHGLVDAEYPALSALAMSTLDENGTPQDGLLRLDDIYKLDLGAELVVLSACDTALGEEIRGEGLVGLTQGFMYAGAKTLVVSLWQVPDAATAELMIRFYRNTFEQQQRPAEALRNAQLSIAAEPRWRDPYFWGAFTVMGDWR